eukprot:19054-Heterococcus_DN1.PRE.1
MPTNSRNTALPLALYRKPKFSAILRAIAFNLFDCVIAMQAANAEKYINRCLPQMGCRLQLPTPLLSEVLTRAKRPVYYHNAMPEEIAHAIEADARHMYSYA